MNNLMAEMQCALIANWDRGGRLESAIIKHRFQTLLKK